jgi:hypothetical protein
MHGKARRMDGLALLPETSKRENNTLADPRWDLKRLEPATIVAPRHFQGVLS